MEIEEPVAGTGRFHDPVAKEPFPGTLEAFDPAGPGGIRRKGAAVIQRFHLGAAAH